MEAEGELFVLGCRVVVQRLDDLRTHMGHVKKLQGTKLQHPDTFRSDQETVEDVWRKLVM